MFRSYLSQLIKRVLAKRVILSSSGVSNIIRKKSKLFKFKLFNFLLRKSEISLNCNSSPSDSSTIWTTYYNKCKPYISQNEDLSTYTTLTLTTLIL